MFSLNKKSVLFVASLALVNASSAFANESSTYDWNGVYVGGYVGGATGADVSSSEPYNSGTGNYWNVTNVSNNYGTNASFIGGGTVGYNWQIPNTPYVIGAEGEYGYIGSNGSQSDPNSRTFNAQNPNSTPDNGVSSFKVGNSYGYGLIGSRIGYSIDRALIYLKGGAVFTSTQATYTDTNYNITTVNNTTTGYAAGAGVEYALPFEATKNMSVKAEYLYFGIENNLATSFNGFNSNTNISGIHTSKIGLNYKF